MKAIKLIVVGLVMLVLCVGNAFAGGAIGGSKPGTCDFVAWQCMPAGVGCGQADGITMYEPNPTLGYATYTQAFKDCGKVKVVQCYQAKGCTEAQAKKAYPYLWA